jgi:hypothetical protein
MSSRAIAERCFTIPPSIHCLGEWPVAEREESIGARISQLRKDKGTTQKELAERRCRAPSIPLFPRRLNAESPL